VVHEARVVKPDLKAKYISFEKGEGCFLIDSQGKRYLDAASGVGVVALGYGVAAFGAALKEQADALPYVHGMRFANSTVEKLAERVSHWTPEGMQSTFFCCGGSEAVESALKIVRQYYLERGLPERHRFIGRWQSFHGNTLAAQSVGGHILRRKAQLPLLTMWPHIVAPNCYRCPFSLAPEHCGIECAHELERVIRMEGAESIAGFVAEPIVGAAGGAPVPPDDYFGIIRDICNRYDVVFIVDEVITGWGRTGKRFGIEHWDVIPDVIVAAKGISSGYAPLGAVVLHDRIVDVFLSNSGHVEHNFTFAGNPLSCRAGLVALELMEQQAVVENSALRGAQLLKRLETLRSFPFVGDIRGKGLLIGVEFVEDQATKKPFPAEFQVNQWVNRIALELGLVVYPGGGTADGVTGDHILLMPPLVISADETDLLADRLTTTLQQFETELRARKDKGI